ncbi:MAG: hypothetical protein HY390_06795 [Deltaproteobacteria bacterium]|nr:hypothetical protein [Deltaproteobacteria bacterium]
MKYLFRITIVLSGLLLSTQLYAKDPRAMQLMGANMSLMGAYGMGEAGAKNSVECGAENYYACVAAVMDFAGATAATVMAGMQVAEADKLKKSNTLIDGPTPDGGAGCPAEDPNCTAAPTLTPGDVDKVSKDITQKRDSAFTSIRAKGLDIDDIQAHPEKYVSADDLSKIKSENESLLENANGSNSDESLKTRLEPSSSSQNRSVMSQTSYDDAGEEAGVYASLPEDYNVNDLFSQMLQKGTENSAPGYYGNIPFSELDANGRRSLFERVSLKIKKYM